MRKVRCASIVAELDRITINVSERQTVMNTVAQLLHCVGLTDEAEALFLGELMIPRDPYYFLLSSGDCARTR